MYFIVANMYFNFILLPRGN